MQKRTPFIYFLMLVSGCFLSACIKAPKDFDPRGADNTYDGCRIKQIAVQVENGITKTRKIQYNSNNDPVAITGSGGGTGDPNFSFTYDSKHRLIEFVGLYTANSSYENLHRYKYNQNRIVVDTIFTFGQYGGPPPAAVPPNGFIAYRYLKYDNFDRVSQDSIVTIGAHPNVLVNNYSYDQKGNLILSQFDPITNKIVNVVYDDKLSPRRLNSVWMLIDLNYSVNNPVGATSYNTAGLPLKLPLNGYFLRSYYTGPTQITYDCK